jgi:hypothetical protein
MRSSLLRALLPIVFLAVAGIALSGCNSTPAPVAPTPTPVLVTDTFDGALSPGGSNYHILSAKVGNVTTTMTGIGPDPKVTIGMSIGVYSVTACQAVVDNPTATIGSQLFGVANAVNSLCVRVYDQGTIPANTTLTYELTVVHY